MAITRKRIDVANARTMTSDTKVLGATMGEWNKLFTGNFVQNLEADRKRGEILRRNEQFESIKRNMARAQQEVFDVVEAPPPVSNLVGGGRVRFVRITAGGLKPVQIDKSKVYSGFKLRGVRKAAQLQKAEEKKAQRPKKVVRQPKTEKTGVSLFETEISR